MSVDAQKDDSLNRTYESEGEDGDGGNGVREHAPTKNVHISRAHVQIPEEVAQRLALKQAAHTVISPDPLLPVVRAAPGLALLVEEDHVQTQGVYHAALHERDNVHVPADARALGEFGIDVREQAGGDEGRDDVGDEGVHAEREEDLMSVEWQRRQTKDVGDLLYGCLQCCRRLDGVRVEHGGG